MKLRKAKKSCWYRRNTDRRKYAGKRLWMKLVSLMKMVWRKDSRRLEEKHSSSYSEYKLVRSVSLKIAPAVVNGLQ